MIILAIPMPSMWPWTAAVILHWLYDEFWMPFHPLTLATICYLLLALLNIAPGYPVNIYDIEYFDPLWYFKYLYHLGQNFSFDYWLKQSIAHANDLNDMLGIGGYVTFMYFILSMWDKNKAYEEAKWRAYREQKKKLEARLKMREQNQSEGENWYDQY